MPYITEANAAELGRRSGERRRELQENILTLTGALRQSLPKGQANDLDRTIVELLKIVTEQITCTRTLLNDTNFKFCEHCERGGIEPHHRAQLLKALDNLIARKTYLLGIPGPGNLKPTAPRQQRAPAIVPQAVPDTTTPSVPLGLSLPQDDKSA